MKSVIVLVCLAACLLLFLMPVVSAACPGQVVPVPAETFWPPGPYGSITVESSPAGAIITVNGENQGHAPVTISNLWPGSYTITARMTGYQTYTSITTISGPTHSAVYCPLIPQNATSGLSVISSPGNAQVYLDGAYRGTTPLTLGDPSTGTHIIQIRLDGYKEWKSAVEIEDWGTQAVSATLVPDLSRTTGTVMVSSVPSGAAVKLDGNARGVAPLTLKELAPGIHIVQLDLAGYDVWKSTVDIPEGETKNLNVTLIAKSAGSTGYIVVSSVPAGALVMLDGSPAGRTPANSTLKLSSLAPGDHTIALELDGCEPYSTRASVVSGKIAEVSAVLVPAGTATLLISSNPAGADVFVDDVPEGVSPATVEDLEGGNHVITMKREGYLEYSTTTLVSAGDTGRIAADLIPQTTKAVYSPPAVSTLLAALVVVAMFFLRKCR